MADFKLDWEAVGLGGEEKPTAEHFLDWPTFMSTDLGQAEFLAGGLLRPGQQMSLIGDGKVGKSLLALELVQAIATGRAFLGDIERTPARVLYVDLENSHIEIQDRMRALGFSADDVKSVAYASFPAIAPLDTAEGGERLMWLAEQAQAEVVVLDTISRLIGGRENDADTWLALYRHSMLALKRKGVATIRLDHHGKDPGRGGRGSSAKSQDVDAVWELVPAGKAIGNGTPLRLERTHTRSGLGRDAIDLVRLGERDWVNGREGWVPGATRHDVRDTITRDQPWIVAQHLANLADKAGLSQSLGRDRLIAEMKTKYPDEKHGNSVWSEVVRIRKPR